MVTITVLMCTVCLRAGFTKGLRARKKQIENAGNQNTKQKKEGEGKDLEGTREGKWVYLINNQHTQW
jgi:hypothetical protein